MNINVVGTSGSGKSTLARRLAHRLGLPWIELDRLYWRPNWQGAPDGAFFAAIAAGCTAACGRVKVSPTVLTAVAVACAIVAAVLVRIDFYGIYLTVGLA